MPAQPAAPFGLYPVLTLTLVLSGVAACVPPAATSIRPLTPGWEREALERRSQSCWMGNCTTSFSVPAGRLRVETRTKERGATSIPGWDEPAASRVAYSIGSWAIRQLGGTSERTMVGLGTRAASGSAAGDLELHCRVFWIDDEERAFDRREAMDVTWSAIREAQGMTCGTRSASDPAWRFAAGVAPPRDSLAMVIDSLAQAMSPALSPFPPMTLERLAEDGTPEATYQVQHAVGSGSRMMPRLRVQVAREDGDPIAVIHGGGEVLLDVAPGASVEERRVLRLVAAALADMLWSTP